MKHRLQLYALFALVSLAATAFAQPEAGPENGGLRLRLVVVTSPATGMGGYDVRVALLNATKQEVRLRAGWTDKGDIADYIEAFTSIETFPAIAPLVGQGSLTAC